jgi:signal transduction histidine kinase
MRSFDIPYLADWVVSSLRWVLLLAVTVVLSLSEGLTSLPNSILLVMAVLWNLSSTALGIFYRRLRYHRPINLTIDLLAALALFACNQGVGGPMIWAGIIPVCAGAIYYEWRGSLAMAVIITLVESGWTYLNAQGGFQWTALLPAASYNLVAAAIMALAAGFLIRQLRMSYLKVVEARKSAERNAQLVERGRLQAFYQMVETLSGTLNYKLVLDTVLDLCINATGGIESPAGQLVSAVLMFGQHDLVVASARRFTGRDLQCTFPAEKGALQQSLAKAEPTLVKNPASDPELGSILALQTCTTGLVLSLRRGVNSYGAMIFAHPSEIFFSVERIQMLEMISNQAVIAIQNARLYQDLEAEKERIVQTQEEARKKLARDLHDGPIQSVAAIAMRLDVAKHIFSQEPAEIPAELAKIEELARRTTKELRHMLFTLRPLVLESDGLVTALQTMAEKTGETYKQNVQIDVDPAVVEKIELGKQTVIFFLCEEAVNNARKHAKASLINIRLKFFPPHPEITMLEIVDNGVGFNVQEVLGSYEKRGSLGMVNLQERADLINGLLNIESVPGKGTRIQVLIPLSEAASDLLQRGKVK